MNPENGEQELKAIFQIYSIPEEAREELRQLFKKSGREHRNLRWKEGYYDGECQNT